MAFLSHMTARSLLDDSSNNSSNSSPLPPSSEDDDDSPSPPPSSSSSSDSSKSPPPPPKNSPSPPPPSDDDSKSPPPPSKDNSSPPPPSNKGSSPPPPSNNGSSPPPPSKDNSSPPPPPSNKDKDTKSPPKSSNDGDNNKDKNDNNNNNNNDNNNSPSPPPPPTPPPPPPPPPPRSSNSLSPSDDSSSENSTSSNSISNKLPIIIGVTTGVVVLLIALIAIIVVCSKKKKRRDDPIYYMDSGRGPKANVSASVASSGYYNNNPQHHNHASPGPGYYNQNANPGPGYYNNPQHQNHVMNVPPPPGMSSGPDSGGGWMHPPPPPPMMNSGEVSSNYSSGPRMPVLPPPSPSLALGFTKSTFTYDELAQATAGFSQANLLGQGGFGYVHRGMLPNGKNIAVKSLKSGSGQGEREFQAEVEIISRVHHRHLVSLVGYCITGEQRLLVYEFVPNNNLEYHLHGKNRPTMEWSKRLTIALGSAKGLAYLHEDCHPRIIHRDIKAANILLDFNYEAMVADFGLAKLSSDNFTHVSTRVMGTFGYLAPEYAASGKLTEKSDVFSYGVMLLELITGRRPVDPKSDLDDSLVDWARPLLTRAISDGNYGQLADKNLENNYNPSEMARMVACASASIRHSARRRPKMSQIVRALEGDVSLDDLNDVVRLSPASHQSGNGSSDYDSTSGSYDSTMKTIRKEAVNHSHEYGSSTTTSTEHGHHSFTSSDAGHSREHDRSKLGH